MPESLQSEKRFVEGLVVNKLKKVPSSSSVSTKLFSLKLVQLISKNSQIAIEPTSIVLSIIVRVKDSQAVKQLNHISGHVFNNSNSNLISNTSSFESFREGVFSCDGA
ncbi:hypothetical protein KCU65_g381, partial [Aureobasidium melanogenum]